MTFYNAKTLEKHFLSVTSKRQRDKVSGDGTYWNGGQCHWGGSHNLKGDCETLANFFDKTENLKNSRHELTKSSDKASFENKKKQLLRQCEEISNGLQIQTGNASSIGGICIIWKDFASFLEKQLERFRKDVDAVKQGINNTSYNEAKDLRKLESEERKIKKDVEDNLRKVKNEPDEKKRKKILLLVDEDKKKLEKIYQKKKNIALARLGEDFNPTSHVQGIIDGLKEAFERNNNSWGSRTSNNQSNSNTKNESNPANLPDTDFFIPRNNQVSQPFLEKYWKKFIFAIIFLASSYYILNHYEEKP